MINGMEADETVHQEIDREANGHYMNYLGIGTLN
jgi:hypothetical protein